MACRTLTPAGTLAGTPAGSPTPGGWIRSTEEQGVKRGARSCMIGAMHTFASIAIGLLMFATIGVLFAGLIGMVRGNSGATSNRLMRYRVLLQGATLLLLIIFMSLLRS